VRPGDHVGLLAPNGTEFVEGFFGIALLGGVIVPLNARHKAAEVGYIADNADLVVLLTTTGLDEYVDFTEVLRTALPFPRGRAGPAELELHEAPRLRSAVMLRGGGKIGFLDSEFRPARGGHGPRGGPRRAPARARPRHRRDPLHLRNHGPPEGLPAVARGHDAM
jgi:acyl-CoA synthetase (AMP-forming)/AMP-acid ligase II